MNDVDEAIASLIRLRAWAERTRRAVAGDAELTEAVESTIRKAERIHRRIIMNRADTEGVEGGGRKN